MDKTCINCFRFPAYQVNTRGRGEKAWKSLYEFCKKQAESCDFYEPYIDNPNVKCMHLHCGEPHTGRTALFHWEITGHNLWELLVYD